MEALDLCRWCLGYLVELQNVHRDNWGRHMVWRGHVADIWDEEFRGTVTMET